MACARRLLAAEAGHHGLLVLLLRHGAELHVADNNGVSPLHIACRRGHVGVVRYLLSLDVRRVVEVEDNMAETPFYTAVSLGSQQCRLLNPPTNPQLYIDSITYTVPITLPL